MKILITTDLYAVKTNGVVTSVNNLSQALTELGHQVKILTFSTDRTCHREGQVYYLSSHSIEFIYPGLRMPTLGRHPLLQELIDWKPDIIHSQCEFFSFSCAKRIAKHTGAPIVHTCHTLYEQYISYVMPSKTLGEWVIRTVFRTRLKSAGMVIAPTDKTRSMLLKYGVTSPIRVVPTGIRLKQHGTPLSPEQRIQAREALGITESRSVLLNLGRLGVEKNIDELLNLFRSALKAREDMVFLIVGDGPARAGLESAAKELGIEDRVIFTGMVSPDQVQTYYQLADVFISASTSETQGLTYIEAAANALPLLCRRDDCLNGVLIQGENGYAYTNEEEFLTGLGQILADPAWRKSAGAKSASVAEGFSCEAFGKAVEKVYSDTLAQTK